MKGLIVALSLFLTFSFAHAFQNEPDGFRGIKWGAHIGGVESNYRMTFLFESRGFRKFTRDGDELEIGQAKTKPPQYGFFKDRFCEVFVYFEGKLNFLMVKEVTFERFGKPTKEDALGEDFWWRGDLAWIHLKFDPLKDRGRLWIFSKPLMDEALKDWKNKLKKAGEKGF